MIHGHKKSKKQKSQQQIKDQTELSQKINSKLQQFFSFNRKDVSTNQIPKYLQFIALLMQLCTDIPTIFNFRRQLIIRSLEGKSPEEIGQILSGQIKLTTKLIQSDPKSYTIWTYRQWLVKSLFQINPKVIAAEMELIKMLLIKDQKNFHVWNYRNWLNSVHSNIDENLSFTHQKIKSNPFNFSPYHFRTKFIHQKFQKVLQTEISQEQKKDIITYGMPKLLLDEEFESVKTAIFLNPNQEAPWLYYNWLLSQLIPAFIVHQEASDNKVILHFNMKVTNFSHFIEGEFSQIKGQSNRSNVQTWQIQTKNPALIVKSNLQAYRRINVQSTSKLFLGNGVSSKWLDETFKSILQRELQFIDQVIQSEEKPCRFAYLQKASVYKLILQLGTTSKEHEETVEAGLKCIQTIEDEPKAQKYTLKQLEYWQRLKDGALTSLEKHLRSRND